MEYLAIRIIESAPASMRRLTAEMTDAQLRARPADGEWSAVEIVGHVIDTLEVWGERVRRIATEERPFLPGYDQDARVLERRYASAELEQLLARLERVARELAAELRALPAEAWGRVGVHEERGVMTVGEACRVFASSLPEHVAQLVGTRETATTSGPLPGRP